MKLLFTSLCLLLWSYTLTIAQTNNNIVVSQNGDGDYTTITDAINALPSKTFQRYTIYITDGVYNEKIRLEQNNITLKGESLEGTIIAYQQLKKEWTKNRDYIGAAVVNIHADNIIIDNLTIKNTYPNIGPTAYVIFATGTQTIIQNCNLLGNGANSVSLMNYENGRYYLNNCTIEGTVDMMRAMGWCYIENCRFFQKEAIATIWHAAITSAEQKMVVKNCSFDGTEHFFLGRHHYDAQYFLINCHFTHKLADLNIYRKKYPKTPEKERPYIYGDRRYFYNCSRDSGNYPWMTNNLKSFNKKITPEQITAAWTFNNRWYPESTTTPSCVTIVACNQIVTFTFDQPISVFGDLKLASKSGVILTFNKGKGRSVLKFTTDNPLSKTDIRDTFEILSGSATSTNATTTTLALPKRFKKR